MQEKLFELKDLDVLFWESVILITISPPSGMGGPGGVWIVTSEKKEYYIGLDILQCPIRKLDKLTPMLKYKEKIDDYRHPYAVEGNGWRYIPEHMTLIRDDFYDAIMRVYEDEARKKVLGWKYDHMPAIAGLAMGLDGEPERFNEKETYLRWKAHEVAWIAYEEEKKRLALTEEDLRWKTIYPNNKPTFGMEFGEYALLFKEHPENGNVIGVKFSIVYQRKESTPLHISLSKEDIERYNLFVQRYDDVQGPLYVADYQADIENRQAFDQLKTLDDNSVNSFGDFVRSFETMEAAKEYALALANIRGYANKETLIRDLDNQERIYRNLLRKYEGLLSFRRHYEDILHVVCEFEFPRSSCAGGGHISDAIKEQLGLSDEALREMWQYIPLELTKRTQEKAEKIVEECKEALKR